MEFKSGLSGNIALYQYLPQSKSFLAITSKSKLCNQLQVIAKLPNQGDTGKCVNSVYMLSDEQTVLSTSCTPLFFSLKLNTLPRFYCVYSLMRFLHYAGTSEWVEGMNTLLEYFLPAISRSVCIV